MKVTSIAGTSAGTFSIRLESEHPAELALLHLLDGCDAKCAKTEAQSHPEANAAVGAKPDPILVITADVKKSRY